MKARAVELVEAQLARERQEQPTLPDLAVVDVEEHALGWLVCWNSADYARTREEGTELIGQGPYLVDRQDGSIHHIPVTTFLGEDWAELYQESRGSAPDPLLDAVRDVARRDGRLPALRLLRSEAPRLSLPEAAAYVDAVLGGREPAEELTSRTRAPDRRYVLPIKTLTGPARAGTS
ncbi:YrhB domain-containing protein [Actinoplanes ianthinogenes]|nr:YrhB domain-containing protein [Actinoplanes ianthinogenes]